MTRQRRRGRGKKRKKQTRRILYLALELSPRVFPLLNNHSLTECILQSRGCWDAPPLPSTSSISREKVAKYCNNCWGLACHSHYTFYFAGTCFRAVVSPSGGNMKRLWSVNCPQVQGCMVNAYKESSLHPSSIVK